MKFVYKWTKIVWLLCCCASSTLLNAQKIPVAKYELPRHSITFFSDSTFVELVQGADIMPLYGIGDDTLSIGRYMSDKYNYYLTTPPDNRYKELHINVLSEYTDTLSSTLRLVLKSPYHMFKKENPELNDYYFYMIELLYRDFTNSTKNTLYGPFFSDTISIDKPLDCTLLTISILICPTERYAYRFSMLSAWYPVQNQTANHYKFDIPQFTLLYAYRKSYDRYVVPKINKNVILLRGHYLYRNRLPQNWFKRRAKAWKSPYREDE